MNSKTHPPAGHRSAGADIPASHHSGERIDSGDGAETVAAGALVASTLPDSPIVTDPDDSPREPLPELPASLRASARLALDRVLQEGSEMAIGWVDSADAEQWRQEVRQILRVLGHPMITNRDRFTEVPEPEN